MPHKASLILSLILQVSLVASSALGEVIDLYPGADSAFENAVNALQPGDELVVHEGTYSQTGARHLYAAGTVGNPIIVRAADGEARPVITRPDDPATTVTQNGTEIHGSHITFRGLHFEHGDIGLRIHGGTEHITIEDCEISHTSNNAIAMNSGDTDSFIIRGNHIHHTGLYTGGDTEGEGMYVGCNGAACRATNHLIEGNYIHHLRGTSGGGNDGIEIKYGSHSNIIRDNVIHDTTIGRRYPCIFVYGNDGSGTELNIVEGNVMWNCGEAIQVSSDAIIRNNIILGSDTGITATQHGQVAALRNTSIVNNTIYGHSGQCIGLNWSGGTNMTLANNAIYCEGGTAIGNGSGLGSANVSDNYIAGSLGGSSIDDSAFFDGGTAATAFLDTTSGEFWPAAASPLLGTADAAHAPTTDFNGTARTAPFDVGAYETEGLAQNPGWTIVEDFKGTSSADTAAPAAPSGLQVR